MNNQNPSAFPVITSSLGVGYEDRENPLTKPMPYTEITTAGGMTLADHFAGKAMAAIISNQNQMTAAFEIAKEEGATPLEVVAVSAYEYADAMLAERALRNKEAKP